jgi:hypothetical protein
VSQAGSRITAHGQGNKNRWHHQGKQVTRETHHQGVLGGPNEVWPPPPPQQQEEESDISAGPKSSDDNDSDISSNHPPK